MSYIISKENSIISVAIQKMISLGVSASKKMLSGQESVQEDSKGQKILILLTAYKKKAMMTKPQREAILYDLNNLSDKTAFPTVYPLIGKELNYVVTSSDEIVLPDNLVIDCGAYDASSGQFPETGGTGTGGTIKRGNQFDINVSGTIQGIDIPSGASIRAKIDNPGQVLTNWRIYY